MKATVKITKDTEINIASVRIVIPVRFGEEDIPNDFPLRKGDVWEAAVNIDTGKIEGWPAGRAGELNMKVVDGGSYYLIDANGEVIGKIEGNYVPNDIIPGAYGDYVELEINSEGIVTNWPKDPDVSAFFGGNEE